MHALKCSVVTWEAQLTLVSLWLPLFACQANWQRGEEESHYVTWSIWFPGSITAWRAVTSGSGGDHFPIELYHQTRSTTVHRHTMVPWLPKRMQAQLNWHPVIIALTWLAAVIYSHLFSMTYTKTNEWNSRPPILRMKGVNRPNSFPLLWHTKNDNVYVDV